LLEDAVIVSAVRTAVGSFGGQFKDVPATELGAVPVRAALERVGLAGEDVDEVILGCVLQAGPGQNPARQAAIAAGIPKEVPATAMNMLCGSGLKAVAIAAQMISAGDADIVVAGGMENMTRAPYLMPAARFGARVGSIEMIDSMVHDGLIDAFDGIHMGVTAENLADEYGITREQQDEFAAESQLRAETAIREGVFEDEIVSVEVPDKRGTRVVEVVEHPRAGTTAETLGRLRAAFRSENGTVTAGNASGVNDGAAAIVVMSSTAAQERGLHSMGVVESYASVGVEPRIMGIAQRGIRRPIAGRRKGARYRRAAHQPPRRRDRTRSSHRRQRGPHTRHPGARDETLQYPPGGGNARRRRRPGAGRDHPKWHRRVTPSSPIDSGAGPQAWTASQSDQNWATPEATREVTIGSGAIDSASPSPPNADTVASTLRASASGS
jgi:acetyl-CoA C-acetyltransferase